MELNFNKIIRLKKIAIEKTELLNEEKNLGKPVLTNRNLIPQIYDVFKKTIGEEYASVQNRKKFIFIILYLYSPYTLSSNKRMPSGLRDEIANVVNINNKSTISSNYSDIIFLYQNYSDFREDVLRILNNVSTKLNEEVP